MAWASPILALMTSEKGFLSPCWGGGETEEAYRDVTRGKKEKIEYVNDVKFKPRRVTTENDSVYSTYVYIIASVGNDSMRRSSSSTECEEPVMRAQENDARCVSL